MPAYYIYLISSLPMLHFGNKPPFSFEKFLNICQGLILEEDLVILKRISRSGEYEDKEAHPALRAWYDFDTDLRNELVKIRAGHKKIEPAKYLRKDGFIESAVSHLAWNAHRSTSLLEGEKILDAGRWNKLEELSLGHYFDLDSLIIYAVKLLILERWERINSADKERLLAQTLS
ncbi:MAG: DUF2764 family protein [Candidatus Omnitrophota bacterium]